MATKKCLSLGRESCCKLGFEGRVIHAVLGLTEFVCDLAEQSWPLNEGRVMNIVLGLK